jgi:zinc protease
MSTSIISDETSCGAGDHKDSFLTRGVQKSVLSNGLTVLTKEAHDRAVVATVIWYRVGSKNEELGQTGKSHFLEHMLFKGTDRYKKGEIDLITLKNGGANNAFTWLDYTAYYFSFASDRWQAALEIEASRMRHTTFAEEEFNSEKRVVQEELRIGLDGPWEALENEVWATAFRQHPYHWPTVGWIEDLERATAADMKAYYDKWYHPRNATLVIVGDFDTGQTLARVQELFGTISEGPEVKPLDVKEPAQKGEKRVLVKRPTPVQRLLVGYHAPAVAEDDSYVLHVIETLLSTGKTSRLYQRMIEQERSVTMVRASYDDHIDPSLFSIQAELQTGFSLSAVETAICEEIDKLKLSKVSDSELMKAKRQIEADLVLANEEPLQQAVLLGQYQTIADQDRIPAASRGYKFLDTYLDRIRAVTPDTVTRVANRYFAQDNRTVGYLEDDGTGEGTGGSDAEEREDDGFGRSGGARRKLAAGAMISGSQWGRSTAIQKLAQSVSFRSAPADSGSLGNANAGGAGVDTGGAGERSEDGARRDDLRLTRSEKRPKLEVERVVLPNGMILLLSENHSSPSVSIKAVIGAGSRLEADAKAGLASLTGELLDEGTRTHSAQEIAQAVEQVGGKLETFGEYQTAVIQSSFLSNDFLLGLEITADLLENAQFPDDKVRQYVDRRMAQIKSRLDVPRVQASDLFNEIVFHGHPEHRPPIGYAGTVRNLTRQDIAEFYEQHYVPNNATVAIVGDIDCADAKRKIEDLLGRWRFRSSFEVPVVPAPALQAAPIEKFVGAAKEQVNIYIGHVGIDRQNPDYYSLLVLDTILGSSPGFTSRIPRILRDEQGLAYTTFSNITGSARIDRGRFVAYIGTSPQNLNRALIGLRREINRIVNESVTADELEGAKDYLTGSFVFDFQTNAQVAQFLIDAETYHLGFDYLLKYPLVIGAATTEDIARVARQYIHPDRMTTVVVGPVNHRGKVIGSNALQQVP